MLPTNPLAILGEIERIKRGLYGVCVDLFSDYKDYREKTPEEKAAHVSISALLDHEVPQETAFKACADATPDRMEAKRRFGRPLLEDVEARLKQCLDQIPGLEDITKDSPGRTRLLSPWIVDAKRSQLEEALKAVQSFLSGHFPGEE